MNKTIGVMLHRREPRLLNEYYKVALEEGFESLILFTPEDVQLHKRKILAYVNQDGRWKRSLKGYPLIGYDVGYYHDRKTIQKVYKIKQQIPFMGTALGNKDSIQSKLSQSTVIKKHLIPTASTHSANSNSVPILDQMLRLYSSIILKPVQGMGGKNIIKITKTEEGYLTQLGEKSVTLTREELISHISSIYKGKKILIQKWININDQENRVYDIRALMQKNGQGKWQLTGMGLRLGAKKQITSNLKSGGSALEVYPFLKQLFEEEQAQQLYKKTKALAHYSASFLDKKSGGRLIELGLDIAIDREGQIWIIEVNNKPGKTIFKQIPNDQANEQSIRLPLQYAKYLLTTQIRDHRR